MIDRAVAAMNESTVGMRIVNSVYWLLPCGLSASGMTRRLDLSVQGTYCRTALPCRTRAQLHADIIFDGRQGRQADTHD